MGDTAQNETTDVAPINVDCPRCGYDLRGALHARPSETIAYGRCSECGVDFEWADVLDPRRGLPAWNVEFSRSFGDHCRCSLRTALMQLFKPRLFWRELKMTHPLNDSAFLFHALTVLAFGYIAAGVISLALEILGYFFGSGFRPLDWLGVLLFPLFMDTPFIEIMEVVADESVARLYFVVMIGSMLFLPCCFVMLPFSRREAKVKWIHLWRICGYTVTYPVVTVLMMGLLIGVMELAGGFAQSLPGGLLVFRIVMSVVVFAFIPHAMLWWAMASTHYLKMRHGWAIGFLLTILAMVVLGILIVGYVLMNQAMALV